MCGGQTLYFLYDEDGDRWPIAFMPCNLLNTATVLFQYCITWHAAKSCKKENKEMREERERERERKEDGLSRKSIENENDWGFLEKSFFYN